MIRADDHEENTEEEKIEEVDGETEEEEIDDEEEKEEVERFNGPSCIGEQMMKQLVIKR
jgi:hypothetical protein